MNLILIGGIFTLAIISLVVIVIIVNRAKCTLPKTNGCTAIGKDGRLQIPYCSSNDATLTCADQNTVCSGNPPADCAGAYCDYMSKTWKCQSGSAKYNCVNGVCTPDPNGTLTDCSTCRSPDETCDGTGDLPYPATDGKTLFTNFLQRDQFGTYEFMKFGSDSSPACQLTNCSQGKISSYDTGMWCDPNDDGTLCTTSQLASLPNFPGDPYQGKYADLNANYNVSYVTHDNKKEYCKFSTCKQPSWKLVNNICTKKCTNLDSHATETDDNCRITKCDIGKPTPDGTKCTNGGCTSIPFATAYDANCNPTGCSDPTDKVTVYKVDPTGKFCTGVSCTQPSDDYYQYTNSGTLGKCVKTNSCIPDSDPRKKYDPLNNCNADCKDVDSCKAFLGVSSDAGYAFNCTPNNRSCLATVDQKLPQWGGCGSQDFPQYGPKGDGTCGLTVFQQRARFDETSMGCITCLGGESGTDCNPWETDTSKCSYAEGCTYGEAKQRGTPTDAINECISTNQTKYIGYTFGNIQTLQTGEQASLYTNDGSINVNLTGDFQWSPSNITSFNKSSGALIAWDPLGCESDKLDLNDIFNKMTNPPRSSGSLNVFATGSCEKVAGETQGEIDLHTSY